MEGNPIVIVGVARTPQGKLLGALKDLTAVDLGSIAIKAAVERSHIPPQKIDEVIMGCVLPAGIGQAPARQAAIKAGIPNATPCSTINKMCGSGMKAIMFAAADLAAGFSNVCVAGGMESMTNAPYLIPKARQGYRIGHAEIIDHMMMDGLEDAYDKGKPMGYFAELCASQYAFSRKDQDAYAITSLTRAQDAIKKGYFKDEIIPVTIKIKNGTEIIEHDEHPMSVNLEKIPMLPPAFSKDGTITAANSSSISDGASALVLTTLNYATENNLKPLAKIIGVSSHAKAPSEFTTAPIDAIKKLLKKINWTLDQVDLFEINEAFAVVAMAAMKDLNISHDKINIFGSGCALGHPIGASGARIVITLISALRHKKLKRGVASLCIGGGEATAIAIEVMSS